MSNEIRKDYLLNRWTIIAVKRAKRPKDFTTKFAEQKEVRVCPFCPGNEWMTPPAFLLYLPKKDGIEKTKDFDEKRHKGWIVRCFDNLYPALQPNAVAQKGYGLKWESKVSATGKHEIIVESPIHDEHPGVARITQLELVLEAYLDRLKELTRLNYICYIQIFRNHGWGGGASLSHAHTQILATPIVPRLVADELNAAKQYSLENSECAFCNIIDVEVKGPREIYHDENFVVFTPWASISPFEFWIIPKRHMSTIAEISNSEKRDFAKILRVCFGGLTKLLNDPPYNYGLHIAPTEGESNFYHWHLEVHPKLAILAGFELSTGMYINVVSPEVAAESLRIAADKEEKTI